MTPTSPPLALIVAVSQNGVIGRAGGLPWHFSEDLQYFRRVTMGHPIIMGRRTYDSIGRALPGRHNLVITHRPASVEPPAQPVETLEQALEVAQQHPPPPFVIGGASIYAQALPRATDLYVTQVDRQVEGDVFFPEVDWSAYELVEKQPGNAAELAFTHWRRRKAAHL